MRSDPIDRPREVRVNAWNGQESPSEALPENTPWAVKANLAASVQWLAPPAPVDQRDWRHPDVGWGVILPDNDQLSLAERASADDVPELLPLLKARPGSPVLRYNSNLQQGYLRRYYPDAPAQDLSAQAPNPGTGRGRVPQYLMIVGGPDKIPWSVQYALNMSTFVGRLDLPPEGLKNYVAALIDDWAGQTTKACAPVVWSVDHGKPDITWLMARVVAGRLWKLYESDRQLKERVLLSGGLATGDALAAALVAESPALIVTTSHGMTGPLDNEELLRLQLGAPVDLQRKPLSMAQLAGWKPSGAIWYAHACCSAGSDEQSRYKNLLPADGGIGSLLDKVAKAAGAKVAPLAKALLGAEHPLRAFVGHVEPTFDWTLRDPQNNEVVTGAVCDAFYQRLYQQDKRSPIGYALKEIYREAGAFYGAWQEAKQGVDQNIRGMRDWALYRQLVAMDRQTLVILGDPTVALPPLS